MTTVADIVDAVTDGPLPLRLTAYDGSDVGPRDAPFRLHVASERGLSYVLTAPGDLGLARAYVSGDIEAHGVHPGDPYELLRAAEELPLRRPSPAEVLALARELGLSRLRPPQPPPQESLPRWRRTLQGLRHSRSRDAAAIQHHYDVSNSFYEKVLGPSMTYTCALYRSPDDSLETAQEAKYALVADKLGLRPGMRLLDVGCGWGGMVRHAAREHGVRALGVTLSRQQATWAAEAIKKEGLDDLAEVRYLDYRDLPTDAPFDAISSIGLTEHIGVENYPDYFRRLRQLLVPGGRLLNHCITRSDSRASHRTGAFIDRYVFPDGELASPGRLITEIHDAGFEVQHDENLRQHYALTLAAWCRNLVDRWDECVADVGEGTARVWGLYMAGSRLSFERNALQLHQVLCTRTEAGAPDFPLRPDWTP
ncbi:class I SAM-dependent methyltransferase [Quadrisphaera sp. GCM10027208]|uniref:class I SAM-dependent methyltransferase n=1 Tax=Quadrisphaera sp. GCM10027208 TaxID=3273423 RepID=UPI003613A63E